MNDMQSPQINELMTALSKAQATIRIAVKKSDNPYYKSEYADLPQVWNACRESLTNNGLAVTQTIDGTPGSLFLTATLGHISGQWIKSRVPLLMAKNDAQAMGSSISYARRYTLMALVGVCQGDEDDDAESCINQEERAAQDEKKKKKAPAEEPKATEPPKPVAQAVVPPPPKWTTKDVVDWIYSQSDAVCGWYDGFGNQKEWLLKWILFKLETQNITIEKIVTHFMKNQKAGLETLTNWIKLQTGESHV